MNYVKAMEKFGVSYQQIYAWVRKYQEGQEGALQDGRGRKSLKKS
ncbi:helix-turn-helix domain-containing protein [Paenibacillus sp. TC-CSREp1]